MYTVYKHTSPSGKSYIGITRNTMMKRWQQHKYEAQAPRHQGVNSRKLWNALRMHKSGWSHQVLTVTDSLGEANALEGFFIIYYDTFVGGYNSTPGGDGCIDHTLEARRRISEANKGLRNHSTPHSAAAKEKISATKSKEYVVTFPDGHCEVVVGLRQFCKAHNLCNGSMFHVVAGKRAHYKRFKATRLNS